MPWAVPLGAAAAAIVVAGALRRGGTRTGLALIVAGVAVGIAALALVPVVGYVEAVVLPVLAAAAPPYPGRALRRAQNTCQRLGRASSSS